MASDGGYGHPRQAVLISTNRSGSTFLLHCLDSHPEIGCERAEPLAADSVWLKELDMKRHDLMRFLWKKPGYQVTMFKMSYKQTRWVGLDILRQVEPAVIHLHRHDVLRVIVSSAINTAAVAGWVEHPVHSYKPTSAVQIWLEPEDFLDRCRRYVRAVRGMRKQLKRLGLPLLLLRYEDLVGGQVEVNQPAALVQGRICEFLEVDHFSMWAGLRRVNPQPLGEIVENWGEVEGVVRGSEFERFLE